MTRQPAILALRWPTAGLVAYLAVLVLTAAPAAATPASSSRLGHRLASGAATSDQSRKSLEAQLAVEREMQRVQRAWKEADKKAEVAAVVQQLQGVAFDAARASGARTADEINAFKKAHLADIRYASRRWLVDRAVGRQGAVFIALVEASRRDR